jgi:hypothetical protein
MSFIFFMVAATKSIGQIHWTEIGAVINSQINSIVEKLNESNCIL